MEFMNHIGKTHFENKTLQAATEFITKAGQSIQNSTIAIAQALAHVDAERAWEQDGFDSTVDYTKQVFNLGRTQCYNLIKVGKQYIQSAICESILPHHKGNDYSLTQLVALLPLNDTTLAVSMAEQEIITPNMTVNEIKKAVKNALTAEEPTEDSTDETADESTQVDESENIKERAYQNAIASLNELLSFYGQCQTRDYIELLIKRLEEIASEEFNADE